MPLELTECMRQYFSFLSFSAMTYNELLLQKEWWQKCNEILGRDHYRCRDCGRLGFHNGYNYMKVNRIEEIDALLEGWTFNDVVFSKFWADIPTRSPHLFKHIKFDKKSDIDGVSVYDLNLYESETDMFCDVFEIPEKVIAVCNGNIVNLDATAYRYGSIIKKKNSSNTYSWAYLFEFPCELANEIYVNIEYSMLSSINFNITSGNRVITIRYSLYSFQLKGLNIHHTHYTRGCKPWEYENDSLVTLCEDCHKKRHETSRIPLYDQDNRLISNLVPCNRCGGSGYLPQYSHVEHGICFKCYGEGTVIG